MFAPSVSRLVHALLLCTPLLCFVLVASLVVAEPSPEEPKQGGTILLPGRLPFGPTALPTGQVLAPCEDQSLSVLDREAKLLSRWMASARFSGPVTVGPRSSYQLLAAPQASGRVDVLVWDPRTRVLAQAFSFSRGSECVATAWGVSGNVVAAWKNGALEAWNSQGTRVWSSLADFEIRALLVDESLGVYALGKGSVALFDHRGSEVQRWRLDGLPEGVLQTMGGDLYVWTDQGLWRKEFDAKEFSRFDASTQILGVTVDRQDRLIITEPARLRRVGRSGNSLGTIPLSDAAVTGSALDDRGRILVGTEAGLQVWTYDGRLLETLDSRPAASSPQLGEQGVAAWGSTDWRVHVWVGFRWPSFGWPQDGGAAGRPYSARRPASVAARSVNWTEDADFGYFSQMVASGEEQKQREVLERFEAQSNAGTLLETWPFANLILLKIGRSGLTDLIMRDRNHVTNSWPALRLRAYALLAKTATPEDREELIGLLQREYDPSVAAQGTQALAKSGWDGDGRLMRLLADLQGRMPEQSVVADAVVEAARTLWATNGRSADPALVPLVTAIYQGPYPRAIKLKAQKFFQDLLDAP